MLVLPLSVLLIALNAFAGPSPADTLRDLLKKYKKQFVQWDLRDDRSRSYVPEEKALEIKKEIAKALDMDEKADLKIFIHDDSRGALIGGSILVRELGDHDFFVILPDGRTARLEAKGMFWGGDWQGHVVTMFLAKKTWKIFVDGEPWKGDIEFATQALVSKNQLLQGTLVDGKGKSHSIAAPNQKEFSPTLDGIACLKLNDFR